MVKGTKVAVCNELKTDVSVDDADLALNVLDIFTKIIEN